MNNEIEVGEWVRTEDGRIIRITYQLKEFIDEHISISDEKSVEFLGVIVNHSKNKIDLLEDEDFVKIEYYSPRHKKRGTRIFEVSKVLDNCITFENMHCDLFITDGKWSPHDAELEPVIKSILTKESFKEREYVF